MCERQRDRLMDGLVYTARGVQGGWERGICVLRGGHGWGDVIDLTGPVSPEERDPDRWIETEMQQRKGRLDRQIDQEGGMQRGDRRIERDDKERWERQQKKYRGRWRNNLSEERSGWSMKRDKPRAPPFNVYALAKKNIAQMIFL